MFAARLRQLRRSRSLSQEELAERAGLTAKAISALERGERRRPYPHTVRSLADALGVDVAEFATPGSASGSRADAAVGLPLRPPSALLGRDPEVRMLVPLLREQRYPLVTLIGPGGVGKTRLALAVAAELGRATETGDPSDGGVVVVELAPVQDANLVLPTLASALGLQHTGRNDLVGALAGHLAGRRFVVVLDNLEHVSECAGDLAALLARCPELVVLGTSRAPLHIRAEHQVAVPPLDVPDAAAAGSAAAVAESTAVQMFLDRAAAVASPVELTADNAATVATICRRLEGLPLALELAAARTRLLSPVALIARLDDVLAWTGARDLPERQRTLRATLNWSFALLSPDEQLLFRRLSVFPAGFSVDGAAAVAAHDDTMDTLELLLQQSLVTRLDDQHDEVRFRMLEPIRQYAAERLDAAGETASTQDLHARYCSERARSARAGLRGHRLRTELDRLELEHGSLRSTLGHLLDVGRPDEAADLAWNTWMFWAFRGHAGEGVAWMATVADAQPGAEGRCRALTAAAGLHYVAGDIAATRRDADAALRLARELDDDTLIADAGLLAGSAALFAGDLDAAAGILALASDAARVSEDAWAATHVLAAQGQRALMAGEVADAAGLLQQAEDSARRLGNDFSIASILNMRATLEEITGNLVPVPVMLAEATEVALAARLHWPLVYSLPALAGVLAQQGEFDLAAQLFGAAAALAAAHSADPRFPASQQLAEHWESVVRTELGDDAFTRAWSIGRASNLDDVGALAATVRHRARA